MRFGDEDSAMDVSAINRL